MFLFAINCGYSLNMLVGLDFMVATNLFNFLTLFHRGTAFMSMFQCCFLWDSDKVYQNLIFDTFVINDPHQFFNTSKVNTQNIVFCIKCFFLATSFTRFSAISFCFLAVISKPNVQFKEFKDKKFDFGSYLVISIEKTQGNSV